MTTSTNDIRCVFIDTSAWIDLMNKKERHHAAAITFQRSLAPMTFRMDYRHTGIFDEKAW